MYHLTDDEWNSSMYKMHYSLHCQANTLNIFIFFYRNSVPKFCWNKQLLLYKTAPQTAFLSPSFALISSLSSSLLLWLGKKCSLLPLSLLLFIYMTSLLNFTLYSAVWLHEWCMIELKYSSHKIRAPQRTVKNIWITYWMNLLCCSSSSET